MARPPGRPAGDQVVLDEGKLLDAALREFAAAGYDGASVRRLARSLDVSHNLIPKRYGSKDDLWHAAVDHGFAVLLDELAPLLDEAADDELAQLKALIVRFVEANAVRPALMQIVSQEATAGGPRFDHLFDRYIAPVRAAGDEMLRRLAAAGRVRSDSAALVYFFMIHGAGGPFVMPALARRFGIGVDAGDPEAVRELAVAAVEILFRGLVLDDRGES